MERIKFQLINGHDNKALPHVYTALVKPGQTRFTKRIQLRRCKSMIIDFNGSLMQPRYIEYNDSHREWQLIYGWPRGRSWSQGSTYCAIKLIEITPRPESMNREEVKTFAGEYFKKHLGAEPDKLNIRYEDSGLGEFGLIATLGDRAFEISIIPVANRIELTERIHIGNLREPEEEPYKPTTLLLLHQGDDLYLAKNMGVLVILRDGKLYTTMDGEKIMDEVNLPFEIIATKK